MTSPGEEVTVFISPYLSAGAPTLGEAKGLIQLKINYWINKIFKLIISIIKNDFSDANSNHK